MTVAVTRVVKSRDAILFVLAACVVSVNIGSFLSAGVLTRTALVSLVAIGLLFVVAAGGMDLSVGPVAALAAAMGNPLCLLVGLAYGLINGLLVTKTRIPPYVVTLATGVVLIGVGPTSTGSGGGSWLGVSVIVWIAVVTAVIAHVTLTRTRTGLHIYFVGSSEDGAWMSGIRPVPVRVMTYVTAGVLAALAGMAAGQGPSSWEAGMHLDLLVLTAVLIGGASLSGGRGTVLGTVLGSVLCVQLLGILAAWHISEQVQHGVLIVVLLLVAAFNERRQALVRPT